MEKRELFSTEAASLFKVLKEQLAVSSLVKVRILSRYDFLHPGDEYYEAVRGQVLSDPVTDRVHEDELPAGEYAVIAVEYLPGQFDARAEAASQAISIILDSPPSPVRCARIYLLYGKLTENQLAAIRRYLINPVDSREAMLEVPETLEVELTEPPEVPVVEGFVGMDSRQLAVLREELGLAMFQADIELCREYFSRQEERDPTLAELKILDTYWSDHCRHTTFTTRLKSITVEPGPMNAPAAAALEKFRKMSGNGGDGSNGDADGGNTLMDIALAGMRIMRRSGKLERLEESEEVNAASVVIDVDTPEGTEPWLLMFKNETHNHPTEIEPFGGAATCLGGAIRDPLSGRAYVYQALRFTGSADPRQPLDAARPGKLPQRVITTEAARGYSSYGNQVGIATGYVQEVYHPGFEAKRMEVGAVVGAVPRAQVRREQPAPGDVVLLVGGATGRDGIGGATGSSKKHDTGSLSSAAAEVQKGNPPEERALQRFFRQAEVAARIKKSNDFGAGGVSVAVGELADGLEIDLDRIPRKYAGLDGLELALSESQERMAIVVAPQDAEYCIQAAERQNLQATPVARVTADRRLVMFWRGTAIASLSRDFLDSSGASRTAEAVIAAPEGKGPFESAREGEGDGSRASGSRKRADEWIGVITHLNRCGRQGLVERFDSTIGARTVLMPFGGRTQTSPAEAMAARIPAAGGETGTVSVMAAGYDPEIARWSPFHGGFYAVIEAVSRAVAAGASPDEMYLTLQEYFERLEEDPLKWGKPAAALLGALEAQLGLEIAAIGGKDSMSGSFEELHVPPTLAAFAVAPARLDTIVSPEFKSAGSEVLLLEVPVGAYCTLDLGRFRELLRYVHRLIAGGHAAACRSLRTGGIIPAITEMSFGNMIGFDFAGSPNGIDELSSPRYGSFIVELKHGRKAADLPQAPEGTVARRLGHTLRLPAIGLGGKYLQLSYLLEAWEGPLEDVFPNRIGGEKKDLEELDAGSSSRPAGAGKTRNADTASTVSVTASGKTLACPKVCIPVFPGTNCEDETALRFAEAGADVDLRIFRSRDISQVEESIEELAAAVREAQILMIPGGFSAGDEPEGAGKYIAAVLRSPRIMEAV
ncbi:MAG: phosphoribosylformylglycinamidine synthase, partial [Spirochaetota bacterium]|nr:phosphoribosylformylglycinamidine synthase [Spirochaetota bacterium]